MADLNQMTLDELQYYLDDIVDARESFPPDSMSKRALSLDELYLETGNAMNELTKLSEKVVAKMLTKGYSKDEAWEIVDEYTISHAKQYLER